jgi:hypothetical protein
MRRKYHCVLTFSGARAFLRSQTIIIGEESSSEAVTNRVAYKELVEKAKGSLHAHIIGMPSNSTHSPSSPNGESTPGTTLTSQSPSPTTIRKGNHLPLASQIPNNRVTRAARTGENVLNLLIPSNRCYLIEFGAACRRVWLAGVFEIPYVNLLGGLVWRYQ